MGGACVDSERNKQLVLDYLSALVEDVDRLSDLFAQDMNWWLPRTAHTRFGFTVPTVGLDAFLEAQRRGLEQIYQPQKWTPHVMIAEGDFVSTLATLEALTPAGVTYTNEYLFLFRCADGKITDLWEFVDTAYVHDFLASVTPD
jgi:ketosteroid isomerase-like protein